MARKRAASNTAQPPQPPQIERRLAFHRLQMVGVPLVLLVPLLALFGVFGVNIGEASATSGGVRLDVEYPTKFRYKMIGTVEITVRNETGTPLDSARVSIERSYIDAFSTVSFTPSPTEITDTAYVVMLPSIPAGGVGVVSVQIQAEQYWLHDGRVEVSDGDLSLGVDLSTWSLP